MAVGLWVGRRENPRRIIFGWRQCTLWGVADPFLVQTSPLIMVGMMGVGFAVGFAQSHFEITAIAGLLMLCYLLLPVYRKLNIYTLSEYLSKRYDDRSRISYSIIMKDFNNRFCDDRSCVLYRVTIDQLFNSRRHRSDGSSGCKIGK